MKKRYWAMILLMGNVALAQQEFQEQIHELQQKSEKFHVFLNFQSSLDAVEQGENFETKFKARQLRLEFRGDINETIFYRLRHRLNKSNVHADLDNLAHATDLMYAGFRLNKQWTLTIGKMCQEWGGFEFDLNPMNVYEYSDFVEHMDNFMVGGMITYRPNPSHEFNFQITNVRNDQFETIYGKQTDIKPSQSPLTYIMSWNSNLLEGVLQTRWGVGYEQEAQGYASKMAMLGNKINLPKFQIFLDYMYAYQDLDRFGYVVVLPNSKGLESPKILKKTNYNSLITKVEYQPSQQWNLFGKFMYETARTNELPINFYDAKRNSTGYFIGVEYLPFEDQDLRFFATFIRREQYFDGVNAGDSNRFSIGMMYRMKVF